MTSVHQKLMEARIALQSRKLTKTGKNKFANYNYFELADFLPTVQEIFAEKSLCGVVSYGKDEATLTIYNSDDPDDLIEVCSPMSSAALKGAHEIQNLGAVQTYLRRYLWVTAMEIVEHDALDATLGNDDEKPKQKAPAAIKKVEAPQPTQDQQSLNSRLNQRLLELGITPYGIKTVLAITESDDIDSIPENKANALLRVVGPEHVKVFNEGKNSKGTQVIQMPIKEKVGTTSSIEELERAANEAFGDD